MSGNIVLKKRPDQIGVGTCIVSDKAKQYVNQVLESGRLTYGPFTQAFEKKFAAEHGCRFAVFVNSGTSALRISVATLKEKDNWQDGDEIIIPTITFVSDVNIIQHHNLKPVFVDVHPQEYNIDPNKIEAKITSRTRAIMPTHLCGMAADMDPIMALSRKYNLRVIEDACESPFARYNDKPVGAFGDITCFSTYQAHVLATGVGGFAVTDDPELAVILRSTANHGRDGIYLHMDADKGKSEQELKQIVSRRFSFVRPGYSFRCTEFEAAIGLAAMEEGVEKIVNKRQQTANRLAASLGEFDKYIQLPTIPNNRSHVFMMFPLVVRKDVGFSRDDLINHLEQYNVETRMLLPILNQPFIVKRFGDLLPNYPVADYLNQNAFYIGCHESITLNDVEYIEKVLKIFFEAKFATEYEKVSQ